MTSSNERTALRAGPLTAVLEDGGLRWITWDGVEVLRGLYAAVRDRAWGTISPELRDVRLQETAQRFEVTFIADHENGDVGFQWRGEIAGSADGTLTFSFDGDARRPFLKNRIGFCVLHPVDVAGKRLTVATSNGTVRGVFPERISGENPFPDIVALDWEVRSGLTAGLRFEGDRFEMEDQRNWTDASFKTFCTPLHLPRPVEIEAGTHVRQVVRLSIRGGTSHRRAASKPRIRVTTASVGPLPSIGFATPPEGRAIDDQSVQLLKPLRPDHLRVSIHHGQPGWVERAREAADEARRLGAALEVEVVVGDDGAGAEEVVDTILAEDVTVARWLGFPNGSYATTEPVVDALRAALRDTGSGIVGGGSRANYAEFNRAALPLSKLDVAGYPINPQVHAFDTASIVETLEAQGITVRDAIDVCGRIPLAIGPVTLKPRFNSAIGPDGLGSLGPEALAARVDPRQSSMFAAAWALGSLAALARPGVVALTFFETTGPAGLMSETAELYPIYHVFRAVRIGGASALLATQAPRSVAVLGLRTSDHFRVLVANLTDGAQGIHIDLPEGTEAARIRVLDEASLEAFRANGAAWEERDPEMLDPRRLLELSPFAIARIDASLSR